ncbi:MAG: carbohydrate ABC transporter permease [Clostridiaceae bacterium]
MKNGIAMKILIFAFIAVLMILYIFPLLYALNISLMSKLDYMNNPSSLLKSVHFSNYVTAFKKANFGAYIGNSVFYLAVCTVASILMAVFLAFPVSRSYFKLTGFIYALFLAGMFLPDGTIPQFQFILKLHLYNTRLGYMLGLMGGGGIPLFFFTAYIKNIPKEFDEAASIDGCGYFRYVFQMLIPMIKPAIASMAVLSAVNVWNDIIRAMIYLSTPAYYPVSRGLWAFQGQYQVDTTLQMAALIMIAAPIVILYIFLQRYIIDGVVAGAIKA